MMWDCELALEEPLLSTLDPIARTEISRMPRSCLPEKRAARLLRDSFLDSRVHPAFDTIVIMEKQVIVG